MRVYIASDHAGFELKKKLIPYIGSLGHEVVDCGPETLDTEDDYPQTIGPCARTVAGDAGAFGIILGSSGQGEAMVANRETGVRAAVFYGPAPTAPAVDESGTPGTDPYDIIRVAREHNNATVLSLGARFISLDEAKMATRTFLKTSFSGEIRHARRIAEF